MKFFAALVCALLLSGVATCSYALNCSCEDWMDREGYCVDYIKDRIPSFPIPYREDMPDLKNREVADITPGDVAVFHIRNYWHVAYVERVHRDSRGEPTSIDVSEMNFGGGLSFGEFKAKWKSNSQEEWDRAVCCGITDSYGQVTTRNDVDIDTVKQVWSPDETEAGGAALRFKAIVGKVRQVIDRFYDLADL